MEWNRFPVVEKPLAKIPLPPSSPPHGRSVCRTLPSRDSASPPPVRAVFLTQPASLAADLATTELSLLLPERVETKIGTAAAAEPVEARASSPVSDDPVEAAAAEIAAMVGSPMISSPVQPASESLLTSEATPVTAATTQLVASTVPLPAILPAMPAPTNTFAPTILSGGMSLQAAAQALFAPVQPATTVNVALRVSALKAEAAGTSSALGQSSDAMSIASPEASPLKRRSRSRSAADSKTKRKRKTPEQLSILEREFEANPMPNKDVRDHLSSHLGLTSRQVQIWFQNKRAKVKNARGVPGGPSSPETSPRSSPTLLQPLGPPPPIFPEGFTDGQLFFDMMGGGSSLPIFSLAPVTGGSQLHLNVEPTAFENEYMRLKQAVDA